MQNYSFIYIIKCSKSVYYKIIYLVAHELFSEQYPIKGIQATPKNANHANVKDKSTLEFTFKVIDVVPEERIFEMKNYWYPFSMNDAASLNNLVQNPGW